MISNNGYLFCKEELKQAIFAKAFAYLPKAYKPDIKSQLISWSCINQILRANRLCAPRMRMSKGGSIIPESDYTTSRTYRRPSASGYREIVDESFYRLLKEGATLIIDEIDQLHGPLDDFCAKLEEIFKTSLQVNAYMSWGETRGFDTHWDDHDVIIVQISGRKNWFVFPETRKYPMYADLHDPANEAPSEPTWNKVIEEGDVLFIPRGHWHHAIAMNEPSFHLTFGLSSITGMHVIDWLKNSWAKSEIVRQDLPFLGSDIEKLEHLKILKSALFDILKETNLENFEDSLQDHLRPRQRFSLPQAAQNDQIFSDDISIQWNAWKITSCETDQEKDQFSFNVSGKTYTFLEKARSFFERLWSGDPIKFSDLSSNLREMLSDKQIKGLTSELLSRGLVRILHD